MKKTLKINMNFSGYSVGENVVIECDKDNVPLDRFWRNRVRDAKIDGCVEFLTVKKTKKSENK